MCHTRRLRPRHLSMGSTFYAHPHAQGPRGVSHVDHIPSHETQALTAHTRGRGAWERGRGWGRGRGRGRRRRRARARGGDAAVRAARVRALPCALRAYARTTHHTEGETARRRRRRRRRQRARGARDGGGAEQRPLARPLLRLCQRRALWCRARVRKGASVAARDARRRRRAAERSVRGEAAGRGRGG